MTKVQARKAHNRLVAQYQAYKKQCVKNGVLSREYADWIEYYNIDAGKGE